MKAALISKYTIGDGLLSMIIAYHLYECGFDVTIYNTLIHQLKDWFFNCTYKNIPSDELLENELNDYDIVIVIEHKSSYYKKLKTLKDNITFPKTYFIYPTLKKSKHKFLKDNDIVFNSKKSMTSNMAYAVGKILNITDMTKDNGINPPNHLIKHKYDKRILIHPTSNTESKNWKKSKYIKLSKLLQKKGYDVVLGMSSHEYEKYKDIENHKINIKTFSNLNELASYVYESKMVIGNDSGFVHLASNLQIPSITIAGNLRIMNLWRADWLSTKLIVAPKFLPNFKGFRIKDKFWQNFIPIRKVLKTFEDTI